MKKKMLAIMLGIIFSLLLGEIYLRLFNPQLTYLRAGTFSFACFEEGIYRWIKLASNKTCILQSVGNAFPDTIVYTNSLGFRNREIERIKPENTKRVLFSGDSYTMGWGVREEKAFPRLVERLLEKENLPKRVETINGGLAAEGPSEYYLFLKNQSNVVDPDIIVVGFYLGNDVVNRRDIEWVVTDRDGLPQKVRSRTTFVDSSGRLRIRKVPLHYSIPYLRDLHLFVFVMTRIMHVTNSIPTLGKDKTPPIICQFKSWCRELDKEKEEVRKLFIAIKKIANERNQKLLVVIIPAEYQVYDYRESKYGLPVLLPDDKNYPNRQWSEFFTDSNIDYLDLLPVFKKHTNEHTYFALDDHWNPRGHEIAARAITEKLLSILSTTGVE